MDKKKFKTLLLMNISLFTLFATLVVITTFAWFSGQGYQGKTLAYKKHLYIGATDSEVSNFYAQVDSSGSFNYIRISASSGFGDANLYPGSYVYLKTEITNNSQTFKSVSSLYLQKVEYSAVLAPYLFFGKNEPIASRESYIEMSQYNETENKYTIDSIPILTNFTVEPNSTLEVFWYVYIDTSAELEIAGAFINLGNVTLTYSS